MTTTLNPSQSAAVASISSLLSSIAQASKSAVAEINEIEGKESRPPIYKVIGVLLAVASGIFIGASFVFKKKGLIASQKNADPARKGEGHAYLKSVMWWTGMIIMVIGEICNFVAYAFADAILVTPLGALSVVICAILSSIFLKEKLTLFGKIGCFLCIVGATIIALNGPTEQSVSTIAQFQKLFLAPGFLVFGSVVIVCSLVLIFWVAPKFGKKNMLVYISVCSLIGGLSVSCTQGLGAAIVTSIGGNNQFKQWFTYFLLAFVVVTLLTEINYLNKALELFNTAMVTPTYYVLFTFATLVTSTILYQGFKASVMDIITVVLGFLVICCGITLLQMSKIDPEALQNQVGLDRRSTILLAAAKGDVEPTEKHTEEEDPGMDAIRGSAGIIGSIYRARSARRSLMNGDSGARRRWVQRPGSSVQLSDGGLPRHQLYDKPMPMPEDAMDKISLHSGPLSPTFHPTTINFSDNVTSHRYPQHGDKRRATHEEERLHDPVQHGQSTQQFLPAPPPIARQTLTETEHSVTYRDPFSKEGYTSQEPAVPSSATLPKADFPSDTLTARMSRFQSTPDLSLSDPRQTPSGPRPHKVKEFFQHHEPLSIPSKRSRSRTRPQKEGEEDSETEGLVTSPRNDFNPQRSSIDEPWDSGTDGSDDDSGRERNRL